MLRKVSFWKYKLFFRYLKYVLRYFFWAIFSDLGLKGVKFQLKGKVSVAGNARTRTVVQHIGTTSYSTFENRVTFSKDIVRTFTGVLGFKVWIFF
jgi:ribosomal protein S3